MADVFTPEKRSQVMSRIRGKGNRDTELALRKLLREHNITGWRRHLPIPGKPDFAFKRQRVAVFVDGCFWHRCPTCTKRPVANNASFWAKKIQTNVERDERADFALRDKGWKVVRIWEHEFRNPKLVVQRLMSALG